MTVRTYTPPPPRDDLQPGMLATLNVRLLEKHATVDHLWRVIAVHPEGRMHLSFWAPAADLVAAQCITHEWQQVTATMLRCKMCGRTALHP